MNLDRAVNVFAGRIILKNSLVGGWVRPAVKILHPFGVRAGYVFK